LSYLPSRRRLLGAAPLGLAPALLETPPLEAAVADTFPTTPPELTREMVTVAHGNVKRVRELVDAHPALAKAAWDWGFGDWETALGAASHVGNREIAEYLIAKGAHPTIFSAAMLGHLETVKAFIAAQPGVQRIAGPHSLSLLQHARAGGAAAEPVLRYLETLGDAGPAPSVPITAEEMAAVAGTYVFGSGPNDRIEITVVKNSIQFQRPGSDSRGLIHMGERAFHPAGAAAVRIRFTGRHLTINDPDVILTATKV
jgi:hypothetical protein